MLFDNKQSDKSGPSKPRTVCVLLEFLKFQDDITFAFRAVAEPDLQIHTGRDDQTNVRTDA